MKKLKGNTNVNYCKSEKKESVDFGADISSSD